MPNKPRTSQHRGCPPARAGHASSGRRGGTHTCPLLRNRAESAPPQHGRSLATAPEKFRRALLDALGWDVGLVPADLPSGCSAVWFGGIETDWIGHAGNTPAALGAMAHAAGHLSLLHCGHVRDGGRFACVDTPPGNQAVVYGVHTLLDENGDLPGPLFTAEEEAAASSFATALLALCGYPAEVPGPLNPTGLQALRCLG